MHGNFSTFKWLVVFSVAFWPWAELRAQTHSANDLRGARPNILLIMTDDQGYGPIGRHGHPWIQTPSLDKLYDQSVRFDHFMVSSTCAPTRSALMTGRHPMRNGVTHTILERERMTLQATTIAQVLQQADYATAIFGKWHLGDEDAYQPNARGFEHTFIHGGGGIGQSYQCSCADAPGNQYFDPVVRRNGQFVKTKGFCTDVFFQEATRWIEEQRQQTRPFFAYIATNAPHAPYQAPQQFKERFQAMQFDEDAAGFYGMIENIDHNIGQLLEKIDQWQLAENTVVIFMSDNGTSGMQQAAGGKPLGTDSEGRPLFGFNAGMKGLKNTVNEGGVRVPFFVRWTSKLQPDQTRHPLAAHLDLFPTLADLAGASLPSEQVEGRSLLPLLADPESPWPDRYLFDHQGRWPTGADPDEFQWQNFTVRNEQFRLVGREQLYDMQSDPGQSHNCIAQFPEVAQAMIAAYDHWWQQTRPLMVNEQAPLSPTQPYTEAYNCQLQQTGIPDISLP